MGTVFSAPTIGFLTIDEGNNPDNYHGYINVYVYMLVASILALIFNIAAHITDKDNR